jgi:hypothetical protein
VRLGGFQIPTDSSEGLEVGDETRETVAQLVDFSEKPGTGSVTRRQSGRRKRITVKRRHVIIRQRLPLGAPDLRELFTGGPRELSWIKLVVG